jgi:hypothetical protein
VAITRAGGYVLTEKGWQLASKVEEKPKKPAAKKTSGSGAKKPAAKKTAKKP